MQIKVKSFLFLAPILLACSSTNSRETAIKDIAKAESDFQKMSAEKGMAEAFSYFADESGVIRRGGDGVIQGKEAIRKFYSTDFYKSASVTWSPDFIDASQSGDLGYTYGKYKWTGKDSTGNAIELTGLFHTVWKRQSDGNWKYVWD